MNLRAILEQSMGPQYQAMFHAWELCASINMKEIKYINKEFNGEDIETISEIIHEALVEKEISYESFSYEIHVSYNELNEG